MSWWLWRFNECHIHVHTVHWLAGPSWTARTLRMSIDSQDNKRRFTKKFVTDRLIKKTEQYESMLTEATLKHQPNAQYWELNC